MRFLTLTCPSTGRSVFINVDLITSITEAQPVVISLGADHVAVAETVSQILIDIRDGRFTCVT